MIDPRKMRHRVVVQYVELSEPTASGQRTETWKERARLWGCITTLTGVELERARSIEATVTHRIQLRNRAHIKERDRVLWKEHIFSINAVVDPENKNIEVFLYCTEEVQ